MTQPELLRDAIIAGKASDAVAATKQALAEGADPMDLVTRYMIPAMDQVGHLFECEEYFVPELLLAGRAMKGALELIRPLLLSQGATSAGRVVIGTVKGDLHDIGKNLVASMLEGGGFDVIDLGADVPPEKFVQEIKTNGANIVCLSALLTVTMPGMRTTIQALKDAGVRDKVRVLVGGAPVTRQFATEIGADGYSENATGAVALARQFMSAVA
jgi:corrinoid protein of di/trimethylamine methyltransferase